MKPIYMVAMLLLLITSVLADNEEPNIFTFIQNYNGSFGNITSLDSSMDFIVAGSENNNCSVLWNYLYLYVKEDLSQANDVIETVDITENGQKILAVDASGKARIYSEKYNYITFQYDFQLKQTITTDSLGDTTNAYAGAISDDHKKVFLGKASGNVFKYMWNGSQFNYQSTINDLTGSISSISLKGKKMAIAEDGTTVKIYDVTSSGHSLNQTLLFSSTNERKTHLDYCSKEDKYYLTIWSPFDDYVLIYQGEGDEQFQLQQTLRFNGSQVNYASLSIKFQRIAVSLADNFLLYNLDGDLIQNQPVSSFVHFFDHYEGSIILGSTDLLVVYSFCDPQQIYEFYNYETNKCEECTIDNGCIVWDECCWICNASVIGVIVGIIVGVILIILAVGGGIYCFYRRKKQTTVQQDIIEEEGKSDYELRDKELNERRSEDYLVKIA